MPTQRRSYKRITITTSRNRQRIRLGLFFARHKAHSYRRIIITHKNRLLSRNLAIATFLFFAVLANTLFLSDAPTYASNEGEQRHYYLASWEWACEEDCWWQAPGGNAIGAIDLRSIPEISKAGGMPEGFSVFAYEKEQNIRGATYLGIDKQAVADFVWQKLTVEADSTGETGPKPLRGRMGKDVELWIAGERVKAEPFTEAHRQRTIAVFRADYERNRQTYSEETVQKWVGATMQEVYGRMDDDLAREIVPQAHRNKEKLWRKPETVIGDTFVNDDNIAIGDHDPTGPNAFAEGWTQIGGSALEIINNTVRTTNANSQDARAEKDLSSPDHYAEVKVTNTGTGSVSRGAGPMIRVQADGNNSRIFFLARFDNNTILVRKRVGGSNTTLISQGFTFTEGTEYTVRLSINSSDLIEASVNGNVVATITDGTVPANLRTGITLVDQTVSQNPATQYSQVDNFEAGDLRNWIGAGATTNWSDNDNWTTVPEEGKSVLFDGASDGDVTIDEDINIGHLDIRSSYTGTITASSTISATTTNLTIAGGTFDLNGASLTVTDTLTVGDGATLKLQGGETLSIGTLDLQSGSTVIFTGDGGATTFTITDLATTYHNLEINGAADTFRLGAPLTVNGALTLKVGTYNANAASTTVTGLTTIEGGTYKASTASQTLNGGLTISGGIFTGSSGDVDVNGNLTLSSGTLTAPSGAFTLSGNWTKSGGTFTPGANTVTFDATSGTVTIDSGGSAFHNIVFNDGGGGATFRPTTALDVDGTLTLIDGTVDLATNDPNVNIADNITFDGGSVTKGTGTVTFDGDLTYTDYVGTSNLGNITIGASPDTTTLASDLLCDSLTITVGNTLITDGYDIDCGGAITITGTLNASNAGGRTSSINLTGNWANIGTFTPGSSTVIFDGTDQTINDSTTFYDLTKEVSSAATLTFASSTTQTITNTLTLRGASGQLLSLRSSTEGTQWNMDPQGTRDIAFLDVQDSNNINATVVDCVGKNCTNSGNNTNWVFLAAADPDDDAPSAVRPPSQSVGGQFQNLVAMGNYAHARQLMAQFPHLFPDGERQLLRIQIQELQRQVIQLLEKLAGLLQQQISAAQAI